jgi:hypothetical protein
MMDYDHLCDECGEYLEDCGCTDYSDDEDDLEYDDSGRQNLPATSDYGVKLDKISSQLDIIIDRLTHMINHR